MYNAVTAKWQAEARAKEETLAAQLLQALERQQEREAQAERVMLEAKRAERLERETLEGLTDQERAALQQQVQEMPRQLAAEARQQAEQSFLSNLAEWKEKTFVAWRNSEIQAERYSKTLGGKKMREIEQQAQEKLNAYLQEREQRELKAEAHDDPIYRLVYSLGDDERRVYNELLDRQPKIPERLQAVRQGMEAARIDPLTEQYKQAMLNSRGKPWKLDQIKREYAAQGVAVHEIDFTGLA